ncbi:hypothetical protein B9Q13_00425 [Candidatus Marsarchaeota G2 archaeon ECH_B_SAG-G16]|uniref:GS catalytic domain-containing protein n=1 Tax=Candidatus Marsarchaeota G2 archaeon ECH_B_SAG-G16 TaxID=1978167 RepID=A0A2R6C4V9_9ARCH|nr:MAG: hypothetical protein B9Q13_00425 [Candidatus Marsarchaeota G2 archaeon ECH_B_SAG-G16]
MESVLQSVKKDGVKFVKFQWLGNDLLQRALLVSCDSLKEHLKYGVGIPKAQQCFNSLDELVPSGTFGPESSEFRMLPDLSTYRVLPYTQGVARLICEHYNTDLSPSQTDGRILLKRVLNKAQEMGFYVYAGLEAEFYVLRKEANEFRPLEEEGIETTHSYDVLFEYISELGDALSKMGIFVERVKKEYGNSQLEPTIRYKRALEAADDFVTLRDVARGVATKKGLLATFLPKPFNKAPGSGLHVHLSVFDKNENNLFHSQSDKYGMALSEFAQSFIAGILEHTKAMCFVATPLVNSYKRLIPGSWAPSHVCWGFDNRSAAIRVPSRLSGSQSEARIEFRVSDGCANPYLLVSLLVLAGLEGVEKRLEPPQPLNKDVAKMSEAELTQLGAERLPRTLGEALECARKDKWVKRVMGELLFEEYYKARESEWYAYIQSVSEWEVLRYIERV